MQPPPPGGGYGGPPGGGYGGPPGGFTPPPAQPYGGGGQGLALAEGWKRIVALLIDGIGLWLVSIPISLIVGGAFSATSTDFSLRPLLAGVLITVGYFLYFALMIGKTGQTLGGMVMKVKVIGVNGGVVTQEEAFKRAGIHLLQLVPCLGPLAVFVLMIWGLVALFTQAQRQTPWDQFAGTVVVDA